MAASGDYGKPRQALVIRDDIFEDLPSVTVLPLTSELRAAPLIRIDVAPGRDTGLRAASQIMIDKVTTIRRDRIGNRIGHVDNATLGQAARALARFLGLA
jgi:mRNA interferase MazF